MNWPQQQTNLIVLLLRNLTQQGIQYHFAKFEFIGYMRVHEQDYRWLSPQSNSEKKYNIYKM